MDQAIRSQSLRAFVEVAPDCFVSRDKLALDHEALAGAARTLKADMRKAIGGMAPLMGKDTILRICRDVMAEDRDRPRQPPGGPIIETRPALRIPAANAA